MNLIRSVLAVAFAGTNGGDVAIKSHQNTL